MWTSPKLKTFTLANDTFKRIKSNQRLLKNYFQIMYLKKHLYLKSIKNSQNPILGHSNAHLDDETMKKLPEVFTVVNVRIVVSLGKRKGCDWAET